MRLNYITIVRCIGTKRIKRRFERMVHRFVHKLFHVVRPKTKWKTEKRQTSLPVTRNSAYVSETKFLSSDNITEAEKITCYVKLRLKFTLIDNEGLIHGEERKRQTVRCSFYIVILKCLGHSIRWKRPKKYGKTASVWTTSTIFFSRINHLKLG